MSTALQIVGANAVLAGILALVALAVTRVARKPTVAYWLWALVLLKLVTPPLFPVPLRLDLVSHRRSEVAAAAMPTQSAFAPTEPVAALDTGDVIIAPDHAEEVTPGSVQSVGISSPPQQDDAVLRCVGAVGISGQVEELCACVVERDGVLVPFADPPAGRGQRVRQSQRSEEETRNDPGE